MTDKRLKCQSTVIPVSRAVCILYFYFVSVAVIVCSRLLDKFEMSVCVSDRTLSFRTIQHTANAGNSMASTIFCR